MATLTRRVERLEAIYPSLDAEIAKLLKDLSVLENVSEQEIIQRFVQEMREHE